MINTSGHWLKTAGIALSAAILLSACASSEPSRTQQKPRNVVLFVGDGMGVSTVTGIRILEGQLKGGPGEDNVLPWETFPNLALIKTYNTDAQVGDSAGTATALMTGTKTRSGVINIGPDAYRGDCRGSQGQELTTLLEMAMDRGLATGVVTTTTITHATPASTYAKSADRNWEGDGNIPEEQRGRGCKDIAMQLAEFERGGRHMDLAFGGGRHFFLPTSATDPEYPDQQGRRLDGRNLIEDWQARTGGQFVWDKAGFDRLSASTRAPVLGLFEPSHMKYEVDRSNDGAGEPSLAEMTAKAIDILQRRGEGFFLMVEGGRIDHAHHANDAVRALHEGVAMAEAVAVADRMLGEDTLIIVTADHSHTFAIGGYPTRGNPIFGLVVNNDSSGNPRDEHAIAFDGKAYTTLGYYTGEGVPADAGRFDPAEHDTTAPGYRQQSVVATGGGTHGGEDVPAYARGRGAEAVRGVMEQNLLFDVMTQLLD